MLQSLKSKMGMREELKSGSHLRPPSGSDDADVVC